MIIPVVFLAAFFCISSSLGAEQESCYLSKKKEDECAPVFYRIVKPLLRYFDECREKDSQRSQCHDFQNKYVEVQDEYSILLKKHTEILYKLNEINIEYERLKSKNLEFENLQALLTDQIVDLKKTIDLGTVTNELREEIGKIRKIETSKEMFKNQMDNNNNQPNNLENEQSSIPVEYPFPNSCQQTQNKTWVTKEIHFPGLDPFQVGCSLDSETGPGWMMVLHKAQHSKTFNKTIEEYTNGFGHGSKMGNEFFVGLERLHRLTYENPHELIIMLDSARFNYRESCRHFIVGNQSSGYRTESMDSCYILPNQHEHDILLQGIKFSTFDRDVDEDPNRNWAKEKGFGWWWPSSTIRIKLSATNFRVKMMIRRKT